MLRSDCERIKIGKKEERCSKTVFKDNPKDFVRTFLTEELVSLCSSPDFLPQ